MPSRAELRTSSAKLGRRLAIGVALLIAVPLALVPYYGRFLRIEDPLARADAVFVLGGGRADRFLEAVDLYRAGYAPRILLSPGYPSGGAIALSARGIQYPTEADIARDIMLKLGVPSDAILMLDRTTDSTAEEAEALRALASASGWRHVIVVTSKLHTRRARLAMRRALAAAPVEVIVRASRYDRSDPARWWRRRADVRGTVSELLKLVAYALGIR